MLELGEMRAVAVCAWGLLLASSCAGKAEPSRSGQGGSAGAPLESGSSGSGGFTAPGGRPGAGGSALGGAGGGALGGMGGRMTGVAGAGGSGGRPMDGGVGCDAVSPSPVCDYGLPCQSDSECLHGACYVPGTGENPICAANCTSDRDCPEGSICATSYPDQYCFIACESEADCQGINEHPGNPVRCVTLEDGQVCAQESEP